MSEKDLARINPAGLVPERDPDLAAPIPRGPTPGGRCDLCHDTGKVFARAGDSIAPYVFKCVCGRGQWHRGLPPWSQADKSKFEVIR